MASFLLSVLEANQRAGILTVICKIGFRIRTLKSNFNLSTSVFFIAKYFEVLKLKNYWCLGVERKNIIWKDWLW